LHFWNTEEEATQVLDEENIRNYNSAMERNPLGLPKEHYQIRRSEIYKVLNPQQQGTLRLIENLYSLTNEGSGVTHEVLFNHGLKVDRILGDVMKGKVSSLPIPGTFHHLPGYERILWRITQPSGDYSPLIMFKLMYYRDAMFLHADEGRLHKVTGIAQKLIKSIEYPAVISDDEGFRFENQAFIDKFASEIQ
jgi:hypothetical protein